MRSQYSLKFLLCSVLLAAIWATIVSLAGIVEASITTVGIVALLVASRDKRLAIWLRLVIGSTALGAVWFAAVDWSWFTGGCPHCGHWRDIVQIRVLGIAIHQTAYDDPSEMELIGVDLGRPCGHEGLSLWHKHRWWGGVYCCCPCWNGIYRLSGDRWYGPPERAAVQAMVREHPELADEFHRRVLDEHDTNYVSNFCDELHDRVRRDGADPTHPGEDK